MVKNFSNSHFNKFIEKITKAKFDFMKNFCLIKNDKAKEEGEGDIGS